MPENDFLPFCPNDTGSNLESQSAYAIDTSRTNGNQVGVASSQLVNKALRQATYIVSQFAQFMANYTGDDIVDDATPPKLLAQIGAAFGILPPVFTRYATGGGGTITGTHNLSYYFFIASGNATASATYTNNGITYTVSKTVSGGLQLVCTGSGAPQLSGTLTKASGTGDSSLTFYAFRAPVFLKVKGVGGGGGGQGSGTSPGNGTKGGDTTFGSLITAGGGNPGTSSGSGTGGSATITLSSGIIGIPANGGGGGAIQTPAAGQFSEGGTGGNSAFGGGGRGVAGGVAGNSGATNSGGGGGGAGSPTSGTSSGAGGGSGGYCELDITDPTTIAVSSFAFAVGGGGDEGAAGGGTGAVTGGFGGSGVLMIEEYFQ